MRRVLPIVLSLSLVVSGLGFVPTAKMVPAAEASGTIFGLCQQQRWFPMPRPRLPVRDSGES